MNDAIVEFLLTRYAEDEQIARDAPGPAWHVAVERTGSPGNWRGVGAYLLTLAPSDPYDSLSVGEEIARSTGPRPFVVDHAARWDPARVLAECEKNRRIVELAVAWQWAADNPPSVEIGRGLLGTAQQLLSVLRLLALPYADHPDFRPEWRTA